MITVVSLNPSIDRTLRMKNFSAGSTNRVDSVRIDAGGKGINVCRHLKALGAEDVLCIGLMRAADEEMFSAALRQCGVRYEWLTLPGHVRTNTKICTDSGELTEINEAGEPVSADVPEMLTGLVRQAIKQSDCIVLTGSVPPGMPKGIYAELIRIARDMGKPCLLDADGEALRLGIAAGPGFIKPNRSELERLLSRALPDDQSLRAAVREVMDCGVPCGCISLGGDGAVYFAQDGLWKLRAPEVAVRSSVGAGDAMLAAFALGMAEKLPGNEVFRRAVACGSAAVTSEGTQGIDAETVRGLLGMIHEPELLV